MQEDETLLSDLACLFANIGQGGTSLKILEGLAELTGRKVYFAYAAHVKSRYFKGTAFVGLNYLFGKLGAQVFSEYTLIMLMIPLLLRAARFKAALGCVRVLINARNPALRQAALGLNASIREMLQSPQAVV
ncbi:MAG: hypothetical protein ACK52H_15375 [Burkholderiales bacterium]|jgi:hypothetical protein